MAHHHSDRGSQYLSIRYSERLAEAGKEPSVGGVGDSYDNALAETINGLFKAEVIHRRGPWRSLEAVEYATLEGVDWFNNRRLLEPIGNILPAEAEANSHAFLETDPMAAELTLISLRQTRRGSIRCTTGFFMVGYTRVMIAKSSRPFLSPNTSLPSGNDAAPAIGIGSDEAVNYCGVATTSHL